MTSMLDKAERFDLDAAPIRVGRVSLAVRDLERVARFYRDVLGLRVTEEAPGRVTLGAGSRPLLALEGDPALAPRDPRGAGLFHVAFLLPTRADLAHWLAHARSLGIRIDGASDHGVSEAIYLADPEGNGIEIYVDRPPAAWPRQGDAVAMMTERLDLPGLLAAGAGGSWAGMPDAAVVGHVHLQVGDLPEAERFYAGLLGFEVMCRYPGASFFGAGGYHHQLAANIWNSAGAAIRSDDMAGLREIELILDAAAAQDLRGALPDAESGEIKVRDKWGTRIVLHATTR